MGGGRLMPIAAALLTMAPASERPGVAAAAHESPAADGVIEEVCTSLLLGDFAA